MQLKRYTDYSLRVLLHLAVYPDRIISINEIAHAYDISRNHLLKVVNALVEIQLVQTFRGKTGGLQLAKLPNEINVGELVRHMEGENPIVNCQNPSCVILPVCTLSSVLHEAYWEFIQYLNRYTLADLLRGKQNKLQQLLEQGVG